MPVRSEGGQRLYSDLDIRRLRLLRRLTERGHSISRIATLSVDALTQLDTDSAGSDDGDWATSTTAPEGENLDEVVDTALNATRRLDQWALQAHLEQAAMTLGALDFLDHVAGPVLDEIGRGWAEGTVSVAQEHLATAVFRRVLGWLLGVYEVRRAAPRLVVSTPAGEMHELGALMVAVAAAAEGWYVTYLGPDLPAADLLDAATTSGASAVALSAVHAPYPSALLSAIRQTRKELSADTALILGGAAAPHLPLEPADEGIMLVETLQDLRFVLSRLAAAAGTDTTSG